MHAESHTLIRNTLSNFGLQLYLTLLAFLTTPYIVNTMGASAYGMLTLAGVFIGYLGFMDFGLSVAIEKSVAEWKEKGNTETVGRIISTGALSQAALGTIGGFTIWTASGWLIHTVLDIPPEMTNAALVALHLGAVGFAADMPRAAFSAVLRAYGRFDIMNRILMGIRSVQMLGTVGLLVAGYGLPEIMFLHAGLVFVHLAVLPAVIRITLPQIHLGLLPQWQTAKTLFGFGGLVTIGYAASTIAAEIDKLLLGIFLPIAQLTFYQIPYNLSQRVLSVAPNITSTVFPAFAELRATNQHDRLRSLYTRASKYLLTVMFPFAAILFLFAPEIMRYWIGENFVGTASTALRICAIGILVNATTWVPSRVSVAAGRPNLTVKMNTIQAITGVSLCLILIPTYGVIGAAIAWALRDVLPLSWFLIAVNQWVVDISNRSYLRYAFARWGIVSTVFLLVGLLLQPQAHNLAHLIAISICLIGIYFLLAHLFIFDNQDRQYVRSYARRLLNTFSADSRLFSGLQTESKTIGVSIHTCTDSPFRISQISFYTLTHNRLHYTQRMIESLIQSNREGYQHVFVDQGSQDGTPDYLRTLPRLYPQISWTFIFLEKNIGIVEGQQQALECCKGDLLIKVDNDCRVLTMHINAHLKTIYEMIGADYVLSPFPSGLIDHLGGSARTGYEVYYSKKMDRYYTLGLTNHLGGLFRAVPRPILERVGAWSDYLQQFPEHPLGTREDSYFCRQVLKHGFKMAYIENECMVEHQESTYGQRVRYGPRHFGNESR